MTLAVAWLRRIQDCEELIVASDSRLSGGRTLDCCAKIVPLPRSDSFLCCAGETDITYPLALQVASAIGSYQRSGDRSMDICDLRGHVLKILNSAITSIGTPVKHLQYPEKFTQFLFGGYSWINKEFRIWRLTCSPAEKKFFHHPAPPWFHGRCPVIFIGDWQRIARGRLISLLRARHNIAPQSDADFKFDWEPFEVLRDLLREHAGDKTVSIGGPPQILKIYQHLNSKHIGVFWPNKGSGKIAISGRITLPYERPDHWILDPDTFVSSHAYYSNHEGG